MVSVILTILVVGFIGVMVAILIVAIIIASIKEFFNSSE